MYWNLARGGYTGSVNCGRWLCVRWNKSQVVRSPKLIEILRRARKNQSDSRNRKIKTGWEAVLGASSGTGVLKTGGSRFCGGWHVHRNK